MAEQDPEADENPYRAPNTSPPGPVKMADDQGYRSKIGWVVLFVLVLIVADLFSMLMHIAGPYRPALVMLGLGGFACGAALGAYLSSKNKQRPWWSSCRYAIYGLIGTILTIGIILGLFWR